MSKKPVSKQIELFTEQRRKINEKLEFAYEQLLQKRQFLYIASDHAVVRYLSRVELVSVSEARYKILVMVEEAMNSISDKSVLNDVNIKLHVGNIVFVINNRKIITIEVLEN